ncbi:EscF/YscF/HrpA family type III secretion system needle major subunit [Dyella sp. Tek66A03]|uniref:EscF/YscF/HrpA family type III secretion system needle major subunit n=1 Tax=Dyella sp. Tek66A03 TaxID=3458298 RepID=UPI00403E4F44
MTSTPLTYRAVDSWDGGPQNPGGGDNWDGWLDRHSWRFDTGVGELKAKLDAAFTALAGDGTASNPGDPSNPAKLAGYQTALAEYNMFRMLQSNSSKNLADMQKQNARNLG